MPIHDSLLQAYNQTRNTKLHEPLCFAPFISLNFDQAGNVRACCYNVIHPLGKYPDQSIQEILNSSATSELREAIKRHDLTKGCYNCEQQLLSQNYYSVHARHFDVLREELPRDLGQKPLILEFEISNVCNLECVMCNGFFSSLIRKNREKLPPLPFVYDEKFVDELRPLWKNAMSARFLGGEPFLNSLYFKMWEDIVNENPSLSVSITTNATILTPKVKSILERLKPTLVISLDALTPKTYEQIRVNADYRAVRENIDYLLDYSRREGRGVDLAVCPMTVNWREIPLLFRWGQEQNLYVNLNTVLFPDHLSLRKLPKEELEKIIKEYSRELAVLKKYSPPKVKESFPTEANVKRFESLIAQLEAWRHDVFTT
ncbi:MAG: radical SAM protein [Bdellovibrionales bacterium]